MKRRGPIKAKLLAELTALKAMPDADIDLSDAPEVLDWSGAQRGKYYRPVKQLLSVRLDADLIDCHACAIDNVNIVSETTKQRVSTAATGNRGTSDASGGVHAAARSVPAAACA